VLAVPVSEARALLEAARPHLARARLITDVGSTKRGIVRAAAELGLGERFVGAHPLAGDHRSGWEASRAALFRGALVYLTPSDESSTDAVALARSLWSALGAHVEHLDAATHDARLAWTSHLPQAASTALALALGDAGHARDALGPGGHDATRLAASDPAMWAAIAAENADALGPALGALERRLAELRAAAERGDTVGLRRMFEAARRWAEP
jgi:prephenate dehydrogenase